MTIQIGQRWRYVSDKSMFDFVVEVISTNPMIVEIVQSNAYSKDQGYFVNSRRYNGLDIENRSNLKWTYLEGQDASL